MDKKFVIFRQPFQQGYFIVSETPPFFIGRILLFDSDLDYAAYTNTSKDLVYAQVFPYRILTVCKGSLTGRITATPSIFKEMQLLVQQMAAFFLEEEIKPNKQKYEKYLM